MPSRLIREGILDSRAVNALSDSGEILYRRLMSVVDDFGRTEVDVDLLRLRLFPRKLDQWSVARVAEALAECGRVLDEEHGTALVLCYSVGRKHYLQIANFGQRTKPGQHSRYPEPPGGEQELPGTSGKVPEMSGSSGVCLAETGQSRPARASAPTTPTPSNKSLAFPEKTKVTEITEPENFDFDAWVGERLARHNKKTAKHLNEQALVKRFARDPAARRKFEANHDLWVQTPEWRKANGIFAPKLWQWIEDDAWKWPPARDEPTADAAYYDFPEA